MLIRVECGFFGFSVNFCTWYCSSTVTTPKREASSCETRTTAMTLPPAFAIDTGPLRRPGRDAPDEERKAFLQEQIRNGLELRAWWVQEMLVTPSPLTERMTLFWHNHFVSSQQKVRVARLMYTQNATLRANALGNFGTLLHASSKDPAMLVYLDSAQNRKGQPNENFAREVMELFTLGEGHYTESDVKEAARSFTGWSLDRDTAQYMFRPGIHDYGNKSVLGRSGNFDGDAVLDILLSQPATSEFVTAKLWREFVSPQPDAAEVRRVAAVFRNSGYQVRAALRELLLGRAFWAPENRGALVKSPVELVVGTLRQFDVGMADPMPLAFLLRNLGQDLLSPPNVKGWPGGDAWISSQTLLARKQFVERLMRVDETRVTTAAMARAADPDKPMARRFMQAISDIRFSAGDWLAGFRGRDMPRTLQTVLLATAPAGEQVLAGEGAVLLRAVVADPAYQLK